MLKKIMTGSVIFILLAIGGTIAKGYMETPESAYLRIQRYAADGHWDKFYTSLSRQTRSDLAFLQTHVIAHAKALGIDESEVLSPKESFVRVVPKNHKLLSFFVVESPQINSARRDGNTVILSVTNQLDSAARDVRMVRERGAWMLDVELK